MIAKERGAGCSTSLAGRNDRGRCAAVRRASGLLDGGEQPIDAHRFAQDAHRARQIVRVVAPFALTNDHGDGLPLGRVRSALRTSNPFRIGIIRSSRIHVRLEAEFQPVQRGAAVGRGVHVVSLVAQTLPHCVPDVGTSSTISTRSRVGVTGAFYTGRRRRLLSVSHRRILHYRGPPLRSGG